MFYRGCRYRTILLHNKVVTRWFSRNEKRFPLCVKNNRFKKPVRRGDRRWPYVKTDRTFRSCVLFETFRRKLSFDTPRGSSGNRVMTRH